MPCARSAACVGSSVLGCPPRPAKQTIPGIIHSSRLQRGGKPGEAPVDSDPLSPIRVRSFLTKPYKALHPADCDRPGVLAATTAALLQELRRPRLGPPDAYRSYAVPDWARRTLLGVTA